MIGFKTRYFRNGEYHTDSRLRNWILNQKYARRMGVNVGWGTDTKTGSPSDDPIIVERRVRFVDPETRVEKSFNTGPKVESGPACSLEVYRYGHFFFSKEQALRKCRIWDDALVRTIGGSRRNLVEMLVQIDCIGIKRYLGYEEMMSRWHPEEIRRVIERYYREGMLGGAVYRADARALRFVLRTAGRWLRVANVMRRKVRGTDSPETRQDAGLSG
jgi:hypothetical protein